MAGQCKALIDSIVAHRAKGNSAMVSFVRAKLILKGINLDDHHEWSEDDPRVLQQLRTLARELGLRVT
jgi:hypothetical protein